MTSSDALGKVARCLQGIPTKVSMNAHVRKYTKELRRHGESGPAFSGEFPSERFAMKRGAEAGGFGDAGGRSGPSDGDLGADILAAEEAVSGLESDQVREF
jgi:hypothetical protein